MAQITETQRLFIREFNITDTTSLSIILMNPKVMKYSFRNISTTNDIESYIEDCLHNYKKYGFGQWAVIDKKSLQLIGICGLNSGFNDDNTIIHVNYRFAESSWKQGFATEALKAVIKFAQIVLNLNVLYALIEPENDKSVSIAQQQDFRLEKEIIYRERKVVFYKRG